MLRIGYNRYRQISMCHRFTTLALASSVVATSFKPNSGRFCDNDKRNITTISWGGTLGFQKINAIFTTHVPCVPQWQFRRDLYQRQTSDHRATHDLHVASGVIQALRSECSVYWKKLIDRVFMFISQLPPKSGTMMTYIRFKCWTGISANKKLGNCQLHTSFLLFHSLPTKHVVLNLLWCPSTLSCQKVLPVALWKTFPRNTWHLHVFMDTSCFCFLLFYASQEVPVTCRARRLARCPNHTWDVPNITDQMTKCQVICTIRDSLRWRGTAIFGILAESGESKPIPTCWEILPIRFFGVCEASFCMCVRKKCMYVCLSPSIPLSLLWM